MTTSATVTLTVALMATLAATLSPAVCRPLLQSMWACLRAFAFTHLCMQHHGPEIFIGTYIDSYVGFCPFFMCRLLLQSMWAGLLQDHAILSSQDPLVQVGGGTPAPREEGVRLKMGLLRKGEGED